MEDGTLDSVVCIIAVLDISGIAVVPAVETSGKVGIAVVGSALVSVTSSVVEGCVEEDIVDDSLTRFAMDVSFDVVEVINSNAEDAVVDWESVVDSAVVGVNVV